MKRAISIILLLLLLCLSGAIRAENRWPFVPIPPADEGSYNLLRSKLLPRTLIYIRQRYVDPEKIRPEEMFKGALDYLQRDVPEIVVASGSPATFTASINSAVKRFSGRLKSLDDLWMQMKELLAFIQLNYNGGASLKDIETSLINGTIKSLDPFSVFLTPKLYTELEGTLKEKISGKSVLSTLIRRDGESVGYLKIKRFQDETAKEFLRQLKELHADAGASFKGLILDLRNNPGGILDQALVVAGAFLSGGTIYTTVGAGGKVLDKKDAQSGEGTEPENYPIIVLVNEATGSSAEIVAGALQAHDRALLIGERTFGKGTIQDIFNLGNGYGLKLTVARYLVAGERSIESVGITPDVGLEPVLIEGKQVNLVPGRRPPSGGEDEKVKIAFLRPQFDKEKLEKMRSEEDLGRLELDGDLMAGLAADMIVAAGSARPEDVLKEAGAIVKQTEMGEDGKIASGLSKLGIDWSSGPKAASVKLDVDLMITQDKQEVKVADAGKIINLAFRVANLGKEPIYRLLGVTDSGEPFLNGKEFIFGKVEPGKEVSRVIFLKVPASTESQNIPFKVNFRQDGRPIHACHPRGGGDPGHLTALDSCLRRNDTASKASSSSEGKEGYNSILHVRAVERPKFIFSYRLGTPGETGIPLIIKVGNEGRLPAGDVWASIDNKKGEKGPALSKPKVRIGKLEPGKFKETALEFSIRPGMDGSRVLLALTITDAETFETLNADLKIMPNSGRALPQMGLWHRGPGIELLEKEFPVVAGSNKYTLKAKISDDMAIKDYYVFVGDKKALYRPDPDGNRAVDLNAVLPIATGSNKIVIIARDNNNIVTRRSFIVQRD